MEKVIFFFNYLRSSVTVRKGPSALRERDKEIDIDRDFLQIPEIISDSLEGTRTIERERDKEIDGESDLFLQLPEIISDSLEGTQTIE